MSPAEFYRWTGEQWECGEDGVTWAPSAWLAGESEETGLWMIGQWGHITVCEMEEVA